MRECFSLPGVFFKVKWFFYQEKRALYRLFPGFISYEKAFIKAYRFSNPFQICKRFLQKKGATQIDAYGETPISVLVRVAQECSLTDQDHLLEMGCGRGRGALFLSYLTGCRVTGVDWVPLFMTRARVIAKQGSLPATFLCQDMEEVDFAPFTVIYLYGTCLDEAVICSLVRRMEVSAARIVTVSYPLSDYSDKIYVEKQWRGRFPWGETELYLNKIKN